MTRAVVVGSGPNGLAAALTLAAAGVEVEVLEAADRIGGGTRSSELTIPGLVHDECSGFHPLAIDTPFSREFDLGAHGLHWCSAPVEYAHPLDGGRGAIARRSVRETEDGLGPDGRTWHRIVGRLAESFDRIAPEILQPVAHLPSHPVALGRFGTLALTPAALLARRFETPEARALFAGVAAHAMRDLARPLSSSIGVALGAAAHRYGWQVAEGGSASISNAMAQALESYGGTITTGVTVTDINEVAPAEIVMLDVAPRAAVAILGDRLPRHVAAGLHRYRHGPGAFKVDFAIDGDVPWQHPGSRAAGTVHVGGTMEEMEANERAVARGAMPERPFVLVGQQYLADPSRSVGDLHPLYAYAHVPAGFTGDATAAIEAQIERFAPGFRDRIVARHVTSTTDFERHNANYVGGDVVTGLNSARQLAFRPRIALNPYRLGRRGFYLCSAATPPGAGAHGMCGWNAAQTALRDL